VNIFSMSRAEVNTRYNEIVYSVIVGDTITDEMIIELDMYKAALDRMDIVESLYKVTLDIAHYRDRLDAIHSG